VPEGIALEIAPGLRVAWEDLERTRSDLSGGEPAAEWSLEGELEDGYSALRVLTGATAKGAIILLAGARPDGADAHDAEHPQAVVISSSGELKAIEEALVSTQYSENGQVERVGLELYAEGDDYPVRGAGDATDAAAGEVGALRRERTWLDFRLDGEAGSAVLDVLHP
jgi:hypothetical protein